MSRRRSPARRRRDDVLALQAQLPARPLGQANAKARQRAALLLRQFVPGTGRDQRDVGGVHPDEHGLVIAVRLRAD